MSWLTAERALLAFLAAIAAGAAFVGGALALFTDTASVPNNTFATATEFPAPWWNTSYAYRQKITVTGNAATAAAAGKTVRATLNTASLVSAGKMQADGDDLRIVYWDGTSSVELSRQVFQMNSAVTHVWFPLQATIGNGASDDGYYLYYGNASAASPPTNLGATTAKSFYSGDGNTSFQDATLDCGARTTNYNDWGGGDQKVDAEPGVAGCSGETQVALMEWSNFFGTASWQVPTGARIVEDGTSSGTRIRLWGAGNSGNNIAANVVLEPWTDSQVTWDNRQTGIAWSGNGGAGAIVSNNEVTGFDGVSAEGQESASMGTGATTWGGTDGAEGPAFPFLSGPATVQRWVVGALANNGLVAHFPFGTGFANGVEWRGEEEITATTRPRLVVVYYDHYQPEPTVSLGAEETAP